MEVRDLVEAYTQVYQDQELGEAKEDENLTPLQKIRNRNKRDSASLVSSPGGQTDERRAYHKAGRGKKKKRGAKSVFGTMRHVGGPYNEEIDIYDIILSHLLDESYADTIESAEAIVENMSESWRDEILESAQQRLFDQPPATHRRLMSKDPKALESPGNRMDTRAGELERRAMENPDNPGLRRNARRQRAAAKVVAGAFGSARNPQ